MLTRQRSSSLRRNESKLWIYFFLFVLTQVLISFFLCHEVEPANNGNFLTILSISKASVKSEQNGRKDNTLKQVKFGEERGDQMGDGHHENIRISNDIENVEVTKSRELQTESSIFTESLIDNHDIHLDGKIDTREAWEHLERLPLWAKEYFDWHEDQRKLLNETNWRNFKYLVMQCVREDDHCGGISDRLKPLPLLLLMAHRCKRIFLIWWTRPYPLEEFLVPNAINWTVPEYIPLAISNENGKLVTSNRRILRWSKSEETIIRSKVQSFEGGQLTYENETDSTYNEVFHDLFRLVFDPSPTIARILRREIAEAGLVPGHYAVAHYRAFYARASRRPQFIIKSTLNAINCASQLRPGGPIFFASDSLLALATARDYAKNNSFSIVTIENQEPLHLDKAENLTERNPSDFYSIFVDLYLMAMGRCLSFGQGGFGRFGLLLGYNSTCTNRHTWNKQLVPCNWTDAPQIKIDAD